MSDQRVTEQVMVRLRVDQVEKLKQMALEDDRSLAYVVRKAVDAYIGIGRG